MHWTGRVCFNEQGLQFTFNLMARVFPFETTSFWRRALDEQVSSRCPAISCPTSNNTSLYRFHTWESYTHSKIMIPYIHVFITLVRVQVLGTQAWVLCNLHFWQWVLECPLRPGFVPGILLGNDGIKLESVTVWPHSLLFYP